MIVVIEMMDTDGAAIGLAVVVVVVVVVVVMVKGLKGGWVCASESVEEPLLRPPHTPSPPQRFLSTSA